MSYVTRRRLWYPYPQPNVSSTVGKRTNEEREESAENSSASGTGRVGGCHRAMRCLVFASIWLGFLAALVLISLGLWTHCRNCLTIGVILIIACLGVAIHNCLRRGDATPTISIYLERDSHLSMECDDFETAELEEEIAELEAGERGEMEASGTPKCGSVNGGVTGLSHRMSLLIMMRMEMSLEMVSPMYFNTNH